MGESGYRALDVGPGEATQRTLSYGALKQYLCQVGEPLALALGRSSAPPAPIQVGGSTSRSRPSGSMRPPQRTSSGAL